MIKKNENSVVVVTGGSRGIGSATALLCASNGYNICITYLSNAQKANEIVKKIRVLHDVNALAVQVDLCNERDIVNLFDVASEKLGTIKHLINNAGVSGQRTPLDKMTNKELKFVMNVNVVGNFICARETIRRMAYSYGGGAQS